MSRIEEMLEALINGETVDFTPRSRAEQYLKNCIEACGCEGLPTPRSRLDALLYALADKISQGGETVANISDSTVPSKDLTLSAFTRLGHLSFPNATEVGERAFYQCINLTSIDLPVAESIGSYAFQNCNALASITLPAATSIGSYAFQYCDALTSVDLPAATSIGDSAFNDCDALTKVDLPAATSIGDSAFKSCDALTSVDLPVATSIGSYAFQNCNALASITLPAATSIENGAFNDCDALTKVDLPVVTSIGADAFWKCTNFQALIIRTTSTVCVIDPTAIVLATDDNGNPTQLAKFYVPTSMFETYRAAYEAAFEQYGFAGYFDVVFHKIEDFPEICG